MFSFVFQVTKKGELSDFYFNLSRNVAYGADEAESAEREKNQEEEERIQTSEEEIIQISESSHPPTKIGSDSIAAQPGEDSRTPIVESSRDKVTAEPVVESSSQYKFTADIITERPKRDTNRNEYAVAAAKEHFLAQKRAKVVEDSL